MIEQRNHLGLSYLYDKYGAAVFGSILREVEDIELAEQILQSSFMVIWNRPAYYIEQKRLLLAMLAISKVETLKMLAVHSSSKSA